ncbi:hypothetical protein COLO4_08660 [Corchorus olitorius]|uniref:Apple domain-containing protein n=1 Tax=Corchorus olitorius TaxID=93759 RepID=A0A1R3KF17_9ROSI|nr:hypothetical protein COLO4_08660 [Corchorus olitorius]
MSNNEARAALDEEAPAGLKVSRLNTLNSQEKCLRNCSCRSYVSAYYESNGGTGCLTWHGDLVDMRIFTDAGQDFFLRVDAADLGMKNNGRLNKKLMVAIVTVRSVVVVFCMATYAFCSQWRTTRGDVISLYPIERGKKIQRGSKITYIADTNITLLFLFFNFNIYALLMVKLAIAA